MNVYIYSSEENFDFSFIDVRPGESVVLKPNLVKEAKENDPDEWESVITSPRIIERVCAHVCSRLKGKGRVTICDAPQTDSSFAAIAARVDLYGIAARCERLYGVPVEVLDLRNEEWVNENGIISDRRNLAGDPKGVIAFNLGRDSLLHGHPGEGRYYGADYDTSQVNRHHRGETHEYLLCATPIQADVFINLPKLKTHKKTGVTLNLKNLVGINADKNWLPHHTEGAPGNGGDQFPEMGVRRQLERKAVEVARFFAGKVPIFGAGIAQRLRRSGTAAFGDGSSVIRSGNWYGNDTTWRMALDLNRCLLYGNPDGSLRSGRPKRYYCLIDGIVGMEGAGPMQGDAVRSNVVIGGTDPAVVDAVAARVMGFDWRKIPLIREAFKVSRFPVTATPLEDVRVVSDVLAWNGMFEEIRDRRFLNFKPHFGWSGHIEYDQRG
jgi:uncharacterized protein (DUF362 family)